MTVSCGTDIYFTICGSMPHAERSPPSAMIMTNLLMLFLWQQRNQDLQAEVLSSTGPQHDGQCSIAQATVACNGACCLDRDSLQPERRLGIELPMIGRFTCSSHLESPQKTCMKILLAVKFGVAFITG